MSVSHSGSQLLGPTQASSPDGTQSNSLEYKPTQMATAKSSCIASLEGNLQATFVATFYAKATHTHTQHEVNPSETNC